MAVYDIINKMFLYLVLLQWCDESHNISAGKCTLFATAQTGVQSVLRAVTFKQLSPWVDDFKYTSHRVRRNFSPNSYKKLLHKYFNLSGMSSSSLKKNSRSVHKIIAISKEFH
jgi:hypothetical protein